MRYSIVLITALILGQAFGQHDSLSCRSALGTFLRQKRDMQTLLEYAEKEFYAKLPEYTQSCRALLDSIAQYDLWKAVPDPLELQIEKIRLDFYNDPSSDKRGIKPALEKIVDELKQIGTHKVEFAELCNYLGTIYFQEGQVAKNILLYQDAIQSLEESRKPDDARSVLEWMIRTKLANLLCKSDPSRALDFIDAIKSIDINAYQNYAVNPWRKERLENTVSSAWEALGNVLSCLGDARGALIAYQSALTYTDPERPTWDSVILSLVNVQAGLEDSTAVYRTIAWVKKKRPENLSSIFLVAGHAFHQKKNLIIASEFYEDAYRSLKNSPKDEQVKILSNLVNVYSEMHADDLIYNTLSTLLKDSSLMKEDDLAYQFCKASTDIGMRIKKSNGPYKEYFKPAERLLVQRSFGRDFIRDRYAGKFLVLLSQLYISRQDKGDLEKAERPLARIVAGNIEAARKLNLQGEYGSDDVIYAKLSLAKILEIKGDASAAETAYKELISDYSSETIRGTLAFHSSKVGVDSSACALFRFSEMSLKTKLFAKSLQLCTWLCNQKNLPAELRELAEYRMERGYYYWGFLDRNRFQQALAVFSGISKSNRYLQESEFLAALCKWYLDFKQAAVDELITLFTNLQNSTGVEDRVILFLIDENIIGYTRVLSESAFMQGNGEKAQTLLETVLGVIANYKIDTPEEAKAIYALAKFTLHNGLPKEEKLRKTESLLEAFFANKYAAADLWTYFRAGELKMDLDFESGKLSVVSLQQQIERLQHFNDSKEALQEIVESRNFYKGPGLISLEDLDLSGLKEKVQELLAKCTYMLGRVNGQEHRWAEALEAYEVVMRGYTRFDLYASRSLYHEGLIYLAALNKIDKAVDLFIRLFARYGDNELALQAKEDLQEAGRIAKQPQEISAWYHASRKMFEVAKDKSLSRFALELAVYLTERHVGEERRFTRDRAVMSAVIRGFSWVALLDDTVRVRRDDIAGANILLARAYRLEADLRPGSCYGEYGVSYPEKNAKEENACYRRVMDFGEKSDFFGNAQWRFAVNLALLGKTKEALDLLWSYPVSGNAISNLREKYEKEIGVLIAYMAPRKTTAYNKSVQIEVQRLIAETQANGLLPYLTKLFDATQRQVEILKRRTRRSDIKPELLDLKKYSNGKWAAGE